MGAQPPTPGGQVPAKEAQAREVLAQVNALNVQLGHSVEAYDHATWQLGLTRQSLRVNTRRLASARRELHRAQGVLAQRAVTIYEQGDGNATLDIILGANSLGQLLDQVDAVRRIAAEDVKVLAEVRTYRARVSREQRVLEAARARQTRLVADAAAQRNSIQGQLAERSRLLSSIRGEIVRLKAEEAARQARLRAEALARLAAERRAAELARKRAAEEAAREAAARRAAAAAAQARAAAAAERKAAPPPPSPPATAASEPPPPPPPATTATPPPPPPPAPPPPPTTTDLGVTAETPEGASVAPPPSHPEVVDIALNYLGVPYVWAGASPSGFDCSGFVLYVYGQVGVSLPHSAAAQFGYGVAVSRDQLAPGDLVFFDGLDHVGIYIGGDQFVHAPHTGDVVKISSLTDAWYSSHYDGARRL